MSAYVRSTCLIWLPPEALLELSSLANGEASAARLSNFFDAAAGSGAGGVLVVGATMACAACVVDGRNEQRAGSQFGVRVSTGPRTTRLG
jgi:hypothetical protein